MAFWNANATITYNEISSEITGEDPVTGEPIFAETGVTESIRVSLEKSTKEPAIGVLPGKDILNQYFTGRLCDDIYSELPPWYTPAGGEYDIVFDSGLAGKFYTYPTADGRGQLESIFGKAIEGIVKS